MKVRMKVNLLGTRDGVAWPPVGETVDLPDHEGARMCERGFAEPVAETRSEGAEKRPAKRAEVRRKKG